MAFIWLLLILSYLSRAGVLSLLGIAVVVTASMEPYIERGDLVVYANVPYDVGDTLFYCRTPSFCVVHRLIGYEHLSGNGRILFTRGDANGAHDPPVLESMVRGKVLLVVPRELWIPPALLALVYSLWGLMRSRMGLAYASWTLPALLLIISLYVMLSDAPQAERISYPIFSLVGIYYEECTATIAYRGELTLTSATVSVDGESVDANVTNNKIFIRLPKESLTRAFHEDHRPRIVVHGDLGAVGSFKGSYELFAWGKDPDIVLQEKRLIINNTNCFPIDLLVIQDGASRRLSMEPQSVAEVDVSGRNVRVEWLNRGEKRWRVWIVG